MQTSSEQGMQTMNQALLELYRKRFVTKTEILSRTVEVRDLERLLKTIGG
jgi:Tfp pilus assembly ATPase PilU